MSVPGLGFRTAAVLMSLSRPQIAEHLLPDFGRAQQHDLKSHLLLPGGRAWPRRRRRGSGDRDTRSRRSTATFCYRGVSSTDSTERSGSVLPHSIRTAGARRQSRQPPGRSVLAAFIRPSPFQEITDIFAELRSEFGERNFTQRRNVVKADMAGGHEFDEGMQLGLQGVFLLFVDSRRCQQCRQGRRLSRGIRTHAVGHFVSHAFPCLRIDSQDHSRDADEFAGPQRGTPVRH